MPKIQGSVVHENDSDVPPTPFGSRVISFMVNFLIIIGN
jgi:hypothetical protein